jgi:hypothetical protein
MLEFATCKLMNHTKPWKAIGPPKAITRTIATTQMQRILTGAHMIIYSMIISIFLAKHGIWGGQEGAWPELDMSIAVQQMIWDLG